MSIAADYTSGPIPVHFMSPWRPASRGGVVACESRDLSTPATDDPRFANCDACLALMTPAQREMRREQVERYG